ncbi:MAG: hypothetical protein WBP45_02685 [Daejeonella sp.]
MGKQMVTLYDKDAFFIGGRIIKMKKKIRQYYEFNNGFIVRLDESDANPNKETVLIAYNYYEKDYTIKWEFPYDNVIGIHPIIPELKKEEEFITPEHHRKYIEKFKGKELLEVYAGDFRYVLDADTGEIYDKMVSR